MAPRMRAGLQRQDLRRGSFRGRGVVSGAKARDGRKKVRKPLALHEDVLAKAL